MKLIANGIALIFLFGIIPFVSSCNSNPEKKKTETVEDILDRIMEDIDLILEKCLCNGDEDYSPEDDDDDSFDDEDEEYVSDSVKT